MAPKKPLHKFERPSPPRSGGEGGPERSKGPDEGGRPIAGEGTSRRLLLIDDEEDIREVAAMALEAAGPYEIVTAASGTDGIERAVAERPDAILLDVMMPGLDGPSTLRLLRGCEATRDIPVIFLTARVRPSDRQQLTALGARGIIAKPFNPLTLAEEIDEILG